MNFLAQRWRQQPQGAVQIDWNNPLSIGLSSAVIGSNGKDIVAATPLVRIGAAGQEIKSNGIALSSNSTTAHGYSTGYITPQSFTNVSTFTLLEIDAKTTYSQIYCVPNAANTWVDPYAAFGLQFDTNNNYLRLWGTSAPISFSFNSVPVAAGSKGALSVTRSGASATLRFNSTSQTISGGSPNAFSNVNRQPLILLNRSNTSPGEGVDGRIFLHLLWTRALSTFETARLHENPWQIVKPNNRVIYSLPQTVSVSKSRFLFLFN